MLRFGTTIDKQVLAEMRKEIVPKMVGNGMRYVDAMLIFDLAIHAVTEAFATVGSVAMRAPEPLQGITQTLALWILASQTDNVSINLTKDIQK